MTKQFITVSLILDQLKNEKVSSGTRLEDMPKFLEWQVGYIVKPKNDTTTYSIMEIDGAGYGGTFHLAKTDDPEDKRSLRGPTLQSGYVFVSRGDVADPEQIKKTTKPMTISTDTIRTFSPRTKGRPGTRIVLKDGVSYPCAESHDVILGLIEPATTVPELLHNA